METLWVSAIFLHPGQNEFFLSAVEDLPGPVEDLPDPEDLGNLLSPPLEKDLAWPPFPW